VADGEYVLLVLALAGTAAAPMAAWLQREKGFPMPRERRIAAITVLLDAAFAWIAFAGGGAGAGWWASVALLMGVNLVAAFYIAINAVTLPNAIRWGSALFCLIEPAAFAAVLALR